MIRDFKTYDGDQTIECDVCIAGAGAAGISMAREFFGGRDKVVVLESGGLDWDDDTQDLYNGELAGVPYYELTYCRLRYFGGTTNHWGGMCSRLDPIDFEVRDWVPHSGWPVTFDELTPFYARAHPIVDIGELNYNQAEISPPGQVYLALDPDKLVHKMWRYSTPPTVLAEKFRPDFERAENVELLLYANLVEIQTDDQAQTVTGFRIKSLDGKAATVRARVYILAMGGLENVRILLASNKVMPMGLGNRYDLVGRYFMEHLRVTAGTIIFSGTWNESYVHLLHKGQDIRSAIRPSPVMQAREQILNTMTMFGEVDRIRWTSPGYGSLFVIKESLREGRLPNHLGRELWNIVTDLDGIVGGFFEKTDLQTYITIEGEQSPNPDSRATLTDQLDPLGLPRLRLDWQINPMDKRTIRTFVETIGLEFGRLNAGRVKMADWLADPDDRYWTPDLIGENHHIGTARMADDPSRGVVDADCKVHGIDNLYVAGSAVFCTSGCANPTLNLIAFALRLADHIKLRLA
jgi:choline dehydrogenase-like flavoprotein